MKSLDVVVMCKAFAFQEAGSKWTYSQLAEGAYLSVGEAHASIRRLKAARLFDDHSRRIIVAAMEEFLIHGVKYAFAAEIGPNARGIPTSHSAPVFAGEISQSSDDVYVWAHPKGAAKGASIKPLSDGAPRAALQDKQLYDILALVDALRVGRARERNIAIVKLKALLSGSRKDV